MNKRSRTLQSAKYLEKKRSKKYKIFTLSFLCFVSFIILIILILRLDFLQITQAEIIGATTVNTKDIEQKALSMLVGDYLYFIPKSNFLFYPKSSIEKNLIDSNKKINNVEIKYAGNSKINIIIKERDSNILVCEGFHDENDQDDNCFYADGKGFVFAKAPQLSNGVFTRYYISTDIGDGIIGTNFISTDLFNNLQKFIEITKNSGIMSGGILIGTEGNYEMYSKNEDNTDTVIYFNDRNPFDKTAGNLVSFIRDSKIMKKRATTTSMFDSINLRFGNNIFYVTK